MIELASVLLLGIGAQWLAWRLRLPSILLLLLVGFAVGPFTGQRFIDPKAMLGESFTPFVSLAVALILLEGGLTLRLRDLRGNGRAVRNLVIIGSPATFALTALVAKWTLDMDWGMSCLLGAILVVTGPTVIVPLLRHVRPSGTVGSVVHWEGIVTDPLGAILAVLVFQAMVAASAGGGAVTSVLWGLAGALFSGAAAGTLAAAILVIVFIKHWVPDFLHNGVALALGIAAFVSSNAVSHESGLMAVTWMGILLANQNYVVIEHIVEFKENLRVLLISSLFILIAASLPIEEFMRFDLRMLAFVLLMIFLVRPVAVFFSSIGTTLSWRERVFIAWLAPRGVVAAAVSSVFALELAAIDYPGADRLVTVVFAVIVITVMVYGLTAGRLARLLGLAESNPQGTLIVGAQAWARSLAKALQNAGIEVVLIDVNFREIQAARMEGLNVYHSSILAEDLEERVSFAGLGHLLCLTTNDEVNSLACLHHASWFGRENVYQLVAEEGIALEGIPRHLSGRALFDKNLDYWSLETRCRRGSTIKSTKLTKEFDYSDFLAVNEHSGEAPIPLFVIDENEALRVNVSGKDLEPRPGHTVVALVGPE
ncbi:MAG: sodium:proton antiporter [Planctomycetes bacterium]|nr:sodium:proton antiporter [Planctomycetota bacterium]